MICPAQFEAVGHCFASPHSLYPSPRPPRCPRRGRAGGGGYETTGYAFRAGLRVSCHVGLLSLRALRSEWYLDAFLGGSDYGGSGQVLRAALWYHSVRLRHHRMVVARLLCLQFDALVSVTVIRPGFPSRVDPSARFPVASTPAQLPPPPLSGGSGRGELGGRDWDVLGCSF